jgi:predicted alpha/beta-hydrolase family hydrolase
MKPLFLFAPGAGARSSHPWMRHWARLLRKLGRVVTLDYPYMLEGRSRPDPLPRLIDAHREALVRARRRMDTKAPVVLIGKSMGSRIGCHLALEVPVHAVVCLGYPLCGGGDCTKLRGAVLRQMATPVLFVQGTRDPLCPLDLLARVRRRMRAPTALHVVGEGDHSLMVTKRQLRAKGTTQREIDLEVIDVIAKFLATLGVAPSRGPATATFGRKP